MPQFSTRPSLVDDEIDQFLSSLSPTPVSRAVGSQPSSRSSVDDEIDSFLSSLEAAPPPKPPKLESMRPVASHATLSPAGTTILQRLSETNPTEAPWIPVETKLSDLAKRQPTPFNPPRWAGMPPSPVTDLGPEAGGESSWWRRAVADPAVAFMSGVAGLADIPTGVGNIAEGLTGVPKEALAFTLPGMHIGPGKSDATQAQEFLQGWYSPERKQGQIDYDAAETWREKISALINNPSLATMAVFESIPGMVIGGLVGRGLGLASKAMGFAKGALPDWFAAAWGEGFISSVQSIESMRQSNPDGAPTRKQAMLALGTGLATTVIGASGGKLADRFGFVDINTLLASAKKDPVLKMGIAKAIVASASSEGLFEEPFQSGVEQTLQNIGTNKPVLEGVPGAMVLGAAAGGIMGGAGAGYVAGRQRFTPARTSPLAGEPSPAVPPAAEAVVEAPLTVPEPLTVEPAGVMGEDAAKPVKIYTILTGGTAEHPNHSTVSERTLIEGMGWTPPPEAPATPVAASEAPLAPPTPDAGVVAPEPVVPAAKAPQSQAPPAPPIPMTPSVVGVPKVGQRLQNPDTGERGVVEAIDEDGITVTWEKTGGDVIAHEDLQPYLLALEVPSADEIASAAQVDARQRAEDGRAVGEGNAAGQEAPGTRQAVPKGQREEVAAKGAQRLYISDKRGKAILFYHGGQTVRDSFQPGDRLDESGLVWVSSNPEYAAKYGPVVTKLNIRANRVFDVTSDPEARKIWDEYVEKNGAYTGAGEGVSEGYSEDGHPFWENNTVIAKLASEHGYDAVVTSDRSGAVGVGVLPSQLEVIRTPSRSSQPPTAPPRQPASAPAQPAAVASPVVTVNAKFTKNTSFEVNPDLPAQIGLGRPVSALTNRQLLMLRVQAEAWKLDSSPSINADGERLLNQAFNEMERRGQSIETMSEAQARLSKMPREAVAPGHLAESPIVTPTRGPVAGEPRAVPPAAPPAVESVPPPLPPKSAPPPTVTQLTTWYDEQLQGLGGLSAAPIPDLYQKYAGWAQSQGLTPDRQAFNATLLDLGKRGVIGFGPHEHEGRLASEIRENLPVLRESRGPHAPADRAYYWTRMPIPYEKGKPRTLMPMGQAGAAPPPAPPVAERAPLTVVESAPPEPVSKQPWEMTRAEWGREHAALNERATKADTAWRQWSTSSPRDVRGRNAEDKRSEFQDELSRRKREADAAKKAVADFGLFRHKGFIVDAIAAGENIPPEVLADYPDLAPKPAAAPAFAPPVSPEAQARKETRTALQQIQDRKPDAGETLRKAWARIDGRLSDRPTMAADINTPPGRVSSITRSGLDLLVEMGRAEQVWDDAGNVYYVRPGSRPRGFLNKTEVQAREDEVQARKAKPLNMAGQTRPGRPASVTAPTFESVHPSSQTKFNSAWEDRVIGPMQELLHPTNRALRAEWERRTGTALPRGVAATNSAIADYFIQPSNPESIVVPTEPATLETTPEVAVEKVEPEPDEKPAAVAPALTDEEHLNAQLWAMRGKLVWRIVGEGKEFRWQPIQGKEITFKGAPEGYRFHLIKDPSDRSWRVTEHTTGRSTGNGPSESEAVLKASQNLAKLGQEGFSKVVASVLESTPPRPTLENTVKKGKRGQVQEIALEQAQEPDTPAEAAGEIEREVKHVIKTEGMKSGAEVQAAVLKALHNELAGARQIAAKRAEWMQANSDATQAWDSDHPAPPYPNNGTKKDRDEYSDAVAKRGNEREIHREKTVGSFPYGDNPTITIEIPDDGTFTINRTVEAINGVMKRVAGTNSGLGGKKIWDDLVPKVEAGKKSTAKFAPPTTASKKTGGGGGSTASGVGIFSEDEPVRRGTLPLSDISALEVPELVELARDLQADPKVARGFLKPGKVGEFRPGQIRLAASLFKKGQERQLAAALAHEIGHAVDWLPDYTLRRGNLLGRLKTLRDFRKGTFLEPDGTTIKNKQIRTELLALSNLWRPWDETKASATFAAYRKSGKELYADAISVLLNNPGLLETKAPVFYREFFEALDRKPNVKVAYFELQDLLSGTREDIIARRRARVQAGALAGEAKALDMQRARNAEREARKGSYWHTLKAEFYDKNSVINNMVTEAKKRGATVPEDEDPRYFLSERNYVGGKMKAAAEEFVQPIREALEAAGVSWMTFHESLMYDRISSGDRTEYANPEGLAPKDVDELQQNLLDSLTQEQQDVLDTAKQDLRAWVKDISREAHRVGLITDTMMEEIEANEFYAPFRVVEHIEDDISWHIYKQHGTLKSIGNTATASVMKAMATIRAIERQKMLIAAFDFMETKAPAGTIAQAEERWNGKTKEPMEPKASSGTVMVSYYEQGKRRGKVVAEEVANSLNNLSVGQNWSVVRALSFVNSSYFRPVFTTLNLGFQSTNFVRDLLRSWQNRPEASFKDILKSPFLTAKYYAKAVPMARARAFGVKASAGATMRQAGVDVRESEKAGILGLTFNDMMRGRDVADTEIDQVLGKVRIGPERARPYRPGVITTPVHAAKAVLKFIANLGDFIETLPKAAAIVEYRGAGEIADISPAQRAYIREKVGSPDFRKGGTHTPISNNVLLFSNAFLQGTVSDIEVMRGKNGPGARGPGGKGYGPNVRPEGPSTAFGFWWKVTAIAIAPKMAMFAAAYLIGGGGDDDKDETDDQGWLRRFGRMIRAVSEYDITNYLPIPLGENDKGETIYVRMPQSDIGRLMGGLTWKALQFARGDKEAMTSALQVLDYMAGQTPGVAPMLGLISDVAQFAVGGKVYDPFRDRFLFTEDEAADTNWLRKGKKFVGYEFQNLGGGIVWKFYPGEQRPRAQTTGQKILELPVVSSIVGRWIKVSSYGRTEKLREAGSQVRGEEASRRLDSTRAVNKAIGTYMKLPPPQQTRASQQRLAQEVVAGLPGIAPSDVQEKQRAIEKRIRMGVARGESDPVVDAVLGATSNAQKVAVLVSASKDMTSASFAAWLRKAQTEGVISANVVADTRRALGQAPPPTTSRVQTGAYVRVQ